jgi:hypothetical protein
MRRCRLQFVALVVLVALVAAPVLAQRGAGQGKNRGGQTPPGKMMGQGKMMGPGKMGANAGLPPAMLERLREMPPAEQERFLRNNQRFRMLSPEQQAQIRQRLRQWNSLTPEQRQAMRERERIWAEMTPEQRQRVREEIMPRWQQLPPERRQAIQRRLHVLRDLDEQQREERLKDEAFLQGLSPEDRDLLRELARLRLGPPQNEEPPSF